MSLLRGTDPGSGRGLQVLQSVAHHAEEVLEICQLDCRERYLGGAYLRHAGIAHARLPWSIGDRSVLHSVGRGGSAEKAQQECDTVTQSAARLDSYRMVRRFDMGRYSRPEHRARTPSGMRAVKFALTQT